MDRRRFLLTTATGMLLVHAAPAQAAVPLIPRRRLFADPDRSVVRISPDGARIAFLAPLDGVLNLWIAPLSDVTKARALTRVTDRALAPSVRWMYDNRHVVYFREQGGDENWQAHRVDVDTGGIITLTPGPGVKSYIQEVSHHFPGELLIAHNQRDKRFHDLYRVNVATGESRLVETNDRFTYMLTDSKFRVLFGGLYTDDGGMEYLRRGASGEWEPAIRIPMADAMNTRPIEFGDDDNQLYWIDARGRDKAAVVAQDLATGATRVLAEDASADVAWIELEQVSQRPIAAAVNLTRTRWQVIDPAYAADYAYLTKLTTGDLRGISASRDMKRWIVYHEHDDRPGQFFRYDQTTKKARLLFSTRRALETAPLTTMQPLTIRSRDGLPLICYLSRPRGAKRGTPTPMVLLVHGGPWFRDIWGFNSTHQWLANRGYAVLSVNFRGSTGFGKDFVNAANLEWGGKMHDDLIDAVDWAIAHDVAEPKRVAIYGGSYGGYAALVGATFTPEKFACAIDVFGISHLTTFLDTIPPYWRPFQTIWKARMGDYSTEAGRTFLAGRSPLNRVDRIVRPLLIVQGANDVRVTPSESDQLVAAMQKRGIPVTYVFYSDEGHGFRRVENRRSFTAVAELFLAKHLGGRAEPIGDDFKGSTIEFRAGRDLLLLHQ